MPPKNQEQRAARAWTVLAEHAASRTTITYSGLEDRIGVHHRSLNRPLHLIQEYCRDRYPPLTSIVVAVHGGRPSQGFTAWDGENLQEVQQQVYDFDWRGVTNPFQYALGGETEASLARRLVTDPAAAGDVYQLVKVRGAVQSLFRAALREAYADQCALCGLSFVEALDAAHIHAWADASHAERLDVRNGLLLCSNHHRLFDAQRLTIAEDHTIVCSNAEPRCDADRALTADLHGAKLRLPSHRALWPDPAMIRKRNARPPGLAGLGVTQ